LVRRPTPGGGQARGGAVFGLSVPAVLLAELQSIDRADHVLL
jgi:hypothetical protein